MLPSDFAARLLAWYDSSRRELPWRAPPGQVPDPYRVWLSEVMLQQTRVDTVKPYFDRWMKRFPSLEALAEAELDDVLKAWEGLGYYSRARNLHRAVREVVAEHDAAVPSDPATFRKLPGVGRYTAGAVLSIAFSRREAIVDGNVRRVLARLLDDPHPREDTLWEVAAGVVPADRPGDFNQAWMELGATVCTPRSPKCGECPVRGDCRARRMGTQADRPAPTKKSPVRTELHGVAVIDRGGEVLLARRPVDGRLGGLWEFPGASVEGGESAADAAVRAAASLGGVEACVDAPLGRVKHAFTHVTVYYDAFLAHCRDSAPAAELDGRAWVPRSRVADYSLPAAQHRILRLYDDAPTAKRGDATQLLSRGIRK